MSSALLHLDKSRFSTKRNIAWKRFASLLSGLIVCTLVLACGGSPTPASEAEQGTTEDSTNDSDSATPATGKQCADGSCLRCGDDVCAEGFYCDVDSASGPVCASVAACARDMQCSCLSKILPECSCDVRGSTPFLSCN